MIKSRIIPEYEKIDYKPLVLGYTFFKIAEYETDIRGYWKDKQGKLHIDNIELISLPCIRKDYLKLLIKSAFREGEKAVMYKNPYNEAVIIDNEDNKIILKNQIHIIEDRKPSKDYILELLKNHEGLTIYKTVDGQYLIEIYK